MKVYGRGEAAHTALQETWCRFFRGHTYVLLGPSGSGKTTLLSILGCLLSPSAGQLRLDGMDVYGQTPTPREELRRNKIGFVFQQSQLLQFLTIRQNLALIAENVRMSRAVLAARLQELVDRLGISSTLNRFPRELSGGQCQRASIVRALLHRPLVLLADEPTASLDWSNGEQAVKLLIMQAELDASVLIVVTHDTRLAPLFDHQLYLESGRIRTA